MGILDRLKQIKDRVSALDAEQGPQEHETTGEADGMQGILGDLGQRAYRRNDL